MDRWIPEFEKYTSRIPVILIGTHPESEKENSSDLDEKQTVNYEEALAMQKRINEKCDITCAQCFECLPTSGEEFIKEVIAEGVKAALVSRTKRSKKCTIF